MQVVMMDQEFNKLVDKVPLLEINTIAAREHVGEIEREISTVKERICALRTTLPFTFLL